MVDRSPPLARALTTLFLSAWVLVAAFPFVWMFLIAFRYPVDAFSQPPRLLAPFTLTNFATIWLKDRFWQHALSTGIVTLGTMTLSLSIGSLAGYALSRYRGATGFWLLLVALIFRAMPPVVLLTAYKPAFFELGLWNRYETLIMVMVAINQPFTIWMLRSYFLSIPHDLDEAAMVDGCSRLGAFFKAIMPVMWPGVITTGLFSFLLGYNDFLLTSQLMNGDRMTMTAALGAYMNAAGDLTKLMYGIAGAVSITFPLVILVLFFQRRIVSGLLQGAVKG